MIAIFAAVVVGTKGNGSVVWCALAHTLSGSQMVNLSRCAGRANVTAQDAAHICQLSEADAVCFGHDKSTIFGVQPLTSFRQP